MRLLCPGKPRLNWAASRARKFKKPKEIVFKKKNPVTKDLIPFGFAWSDNSCAFDSVLTALIHVLQKLNKKQLEAFQGEVSVFDVLWKISQSEFDDNGLIWRQLKQELRQKLNKSNGTEDSLTIWNALFQEKPTNENPFFRISTTQKLNCVTDCSTQFINWRGTSILIKIPLEQKYESIDHWFNNTYGFRYSSRDCLKCKFPVSKTINFDNDPAFIYLDIQRANYEARGVKFFPRNGAVDSELSFGLNEYELHAVGYGNGGHFKSRFRHANGTNYKYDGLIGCGANAARCFPIDKKEVQFPFYPTENESYSIVFAMYIKKTPEQNYN